MNVMLICYQCDGNIAGEQSFLGMEALKQIFEGLKTGCYKELTHNGSISSAPGRTQMYAH
jgi:hypothetical protein